MPIFLFTDIEKSTEKWKKHKKEMGKVLARHDAIIKEQVENFEGEIIKHTGDGIFAVFEQGAPLHCAIEIQKQFEQEDWGVIGELRIRIGLHAGEAEKREDDYFGEVVNRTQRITDAAWGGQILLTPEVVKSCTLPSNATLQDLGAHLLHDLGDPQQIYGLTASDLKLKEFPQIRSLSAHPHNLPSQPTPFIGRKKELEELSKLLEDPRCRLVNLVGPGGIGKTRLALQAAADRIDKFRHGVYFIPLDALTIGSIQFLVFTIADSLKFPFYSREDPKMQLLNYLREKEMLMVMDNFEHLIAEAELLTEIFENAPSIKFLITSRERLRLKGEWIVEIKGMEFPKRGSGDGFESYGAVQLFVQSAQRVRPDFVLSEKDKPAVVRICQFVQGMPLGIELAASWIRSLSCREIAIEIKRGLDFLTTTLQDVPKRHQSLRSVFEYSWDLLSTKEKKLFRALAVFQNGFQREAAEHVTKMTLRELSSLADKSLVRRNPQGRYEMLQIIKHYAEEKLDEKPSEKEKYNDAHCTYYADLLHQCEKGLKGSEQKETFDQLGEEIENLRAAWRWAIEHGREEEIEKLSKSLYHLYDIRGWLQEGEQIFRMTAEMFKIKYGTEMPDDKKRLRFGKILSRWGGLCRRLSQYEKARELLNESHRIFQKLNARTETVYVLNELGVVAYRLGEYAKARHMHQRALEIRKEWGDELGIAVSLNNLGVIALSIGDYAEAKSLHEQALKIREKKGDRRGLASSMNNLGNVIHKLGENTEAKKLYEKSLAIRKEIGDRIGIASCLNNMGMIAEEIGDYEEAKRLYQESLALKRDIGDLRGTGNTLDNLASVSYKSGDLQESKKYCDEALETLMKIKAIPLVLEVLAGIAKLFAKENKNEYALRVLALILHHPAGTKDLKELAGHLFSDLKAEFTTQEIEAIRKSVETRKFEEVVEEIIKETKK